MARKTKLAPLAQPPASQGRLRAIGVAGAVAAAVAAFASGALVLQHLGAISIPGCGDGSPCAQLSSGPWGKVPVLGVSTASVGLAYFLGMGTVWVVWGVVRGRVSNGVVAVAALGGLVSILLVGVMLSGDGVCPSCMVVHVANFVFIGCALAVWRAGRVAAPRASSLQQVCAVGGIMLAVVAGALGVESRAQVRADRAHEAALGDTVRDLTAGKPTAPQPTAIAPVEPVSTTTKSPAATAPERAAPITGRFRWGPEQAAIRIVMFTDYQCPDCKILEGQLQRVLKSHPSVSAGIRVFPFSTHCNEHVPQNLHPDACFAAAAALAVGELAGPDAFWDMHGWLFERKGAFTPADLSVKASSLGLDGQALVARVNSQSDFGAIREDIQLGRDLGLRYTPMIFINGVELKGFMAPDALVRAVAALVATNPAPTGTENDVPPLAAERYLADWREAAPVELAERFSRRALGPAGAPVSVVVIGDYMEPGTAEVDGVLRAMVAAPGAGMRYGFYLFPMNQECNPNVTFTKFPLACLAARAAEGAALAGGEEGFWRMHEWLMNNREILSETLVGNGAPAIGLDAAVLADVMKGQSVANAISEDTISALEANITSLPAIFINGKPVVSWKAKDENLLPRMIEEASRGLPPTP